MWKWELDLEPIFRDLRAFENEHRILCVTKGPFDSKRLFYRGAIEALFRVLTAAGALDQYIAWKEGSNEKSDNV